MEFDTVDFVVIHKSSTDHCLLLHKSTGDIYITDHSGDSMED